MMRRSLLLSFALASLFGCASVLKAQVTTAPAPAPAAAAPAPAPSPDEKAVRDALTSYVATYNEHDGAKVADMFTDEAAIIDETGSAIRGKDVIAELFLSAFELPTPYTLSADIETIRFISPDVAQVEGMSRLTSPKEATIATRFVALLQKGQQGWKIVEMRDYPAPIEAVPPYERLKELDWMVGDWVDESENAKVSSTVRWGEGKGYLIRNYSVEIPGEDPSSGAMIIAWDPQSGQIKSWVFNSSGGQGEGYWTRAGDNQWVVKANGTTSDGSPSSATQIVTLVNKDVVKTSSIDRIIGGEIAPDIEEVIMVRKAPAPGAAAAPAPAAAPVTAAPAAAPSAAPAPVAVPVRTAPVAAPLAPPAR